MRKAGENPVTRGHRARSIDEFLPKVEEVVGPLERPVGEVLGRAGGLRPDARCSGHRLAHFGA